MINTKHTIHLFFCILISYNSLGQSNNTKFGKLALDNNQTGSWNSAFGYQAMSINTLGYFN